MILRWEKHARILPKAFLGPKWHSLCLLPFKGPKSFDFQGPPPSNGPCNGFARIKIITFRTI
jgi:hypothetical protein